MPSTARRYLIAVPRFASQVLYCCAWPLPAAPLVERRRYLIVVPRPLPAAPLVVRRRHLIVVPRPLPRCASQLLDRGNDADARGAAQVLDLGALAVARGAARYSSQVLHHGTKAVARGAARCLSQVLHCGSQAVAPGVATLPQQEKFNSAGIQRNGANTNGFICAVERRPSRRCTFDETESLAVISRRARHR